MNEEIMSLLCNYQIVDHWKPEELWLFSSPRTNQYYEDLALKYFYITSKVQGDVVGEMSLQNNTPR